MKTVMMTSVKTHKVLVEYRECDGECKPLEKYTTISPMYLRRASFSGDPPQVIRVTIEPVL